MMPLGFSSSTRSSGAVQGSTTENTSSSRILRAINCVYCDPKSRMTMVDDPCVSTTPVYRAPQPCGGSGSGSCRIPYRPSGSFVTTGAYRPSSWRFHQLPVERFSSIEVNQYCQITARTYLGGDCAKGLPRKSVSTSASLSSRRSSVSGTISYCCQSPREANHRFQSKRGW